MPTRQHAVNPESASRAPRRTLAGDAFSAAAIRVLRLGGLLTAAGDALAAPAGQTSARWQVLAAVEDGPAPVAGIARRLNLARQSVQRVADVLAEEGLVRYDDNPEHQRAKLLGLLPAGRAALAEIQSAQRRWSDRLGAEIGETSLRRTVVVLERMMELLEREREQADAG